MTYSIIGILASILLLLTNRDVLRGSKDGETPQVQQNYRKFLLGVLTYYITDALWGILDAHRLTTLQFLDTSVYFASMAAAVLLWTRYVISYLDGENRPEKILYYTGNIFFAFEAAVVLINFFRPILFWFDPDGGYHAAPFRYATLAIQILMFLLTSAYTLAMSRRTEGSERRRNRTIGFFGIAMVILICIQVVYPLMPMYAMGYMLGTCLLHSFVVEDEKEEYRRELEESQEALNEALAKAERASQAKTDFLNNMSHDIRTPMNAILGFTNLASSHLDDRALVEDYLKKISVSGEHMLSLINDVLDMSRIESGRMTLEETQVHLPDLIADLQTIVQAGAEDKGLTFTVDTSGLVHEDIVADKLRLSQVFLNILSNAVKFTPAGGNVLFAVTEKPAEQEGFVDFTFRIRDTGIGMSEEFQETLFEPFTREKTSTVSGIQGTGLGMAITKNIVDMMSGSVEVSSKPGSGTEFVVTIPCRLCGSAAKEEKTETARDFTGKRILLAEDNEMNQMIAEAILTEAGFAADIASNGEIAVQKIREAQPHTFDAVLMDIQMPVLDGYGAARQIRALEQEEGRERLPIIAVTANAFDEDRRLAADAGMDDHLAKPYDVPKMMETLARLIR